MVTIRADPSYISQYSYFTSFKKKKVFGAIVASVADMLLGYGTVSENAKTIEDYLLIYVQLSDKRIILSVLHGMIGISIEASCCFAISDLMKEKASRQALIYKLALIGYSIFGPCSFHVPCLAITFIYKHLYYVDALLALEMVLKYGMYFMLLSLILFMICFFTTVIVQTRVFSKGLTCYPKYYWIFSLAFFAVIAIICLPFSKYPLANAISAAYINLSFLWIFTGLLLNSKQAEKNYLS